MSLHYSVIARGSVVLAECSLQQGSNAGAIARRILERVPDNESAATLASYAQEEWVFHVMAKRGEAVRYLVVANSELGRRIPFAFLEDIQSRFRKMYSEEQLAVALAYAYNNEFGRVLRQQMEFYTSDNPKADAINRVKEEISQVKNVMVQNIDKVLDRGERIELLVDKTDHLQNDAFRFRKAGRALKRQMWWNNMRTMGVLFVIVALLIWFVVSMFCGWKLDQC